MVILFAALLYGLLHGQIVCAESESDSPSFYVPGDCTHPDAADQDLRLVADDEIVIVLVTPSETNETAMDEVYQWAPGTYYGVAVSSSQKTQVMVGVNGEAQRDVRTGTLRLPAEDGDDGGDQGHEDCEGKIWYTSQFSQEHEMLWKAPDCCEFPGTEVQFFVTGTISDDAFLRQQQLLVPGNQSTCDCQDVPPSSDSAPVEIPLPEEKAMTDVDASGTHFTDGEEPEDVIGSGGEIVPDEDDDDDDTFSTTTPKNTKSSFGTAFLVMLLTIVIALCSVWFYRKYRVRQMQYREFEGLEMRGYAQWSDEAGL